MSKFLTLINQKEKNERCSLKQNGCRKIRIDTRALNIAVIVGICCLTIVYLAKINGMAIQGFKMKELDVKQATLKEGIRKTETKVAEMQSMQKIQERIGNLDMVGVAQVKYVSSGGAVAVK